MSKHTESIKDDEPPEDLPSSMETNQSRWNKLQTLGRELGRETWNASKLLLALLVLCGVMYPLLIFAIGQLAFPFQANGSLVTGPHGQVIGSTLLGQQFTRPEYFHGRPSAVGYGASSSGGSNIGPTNPQLITGNGSEVTVQAGTPPPSGGTPVAGKPNTYDVPGSYLGVKAYAEQFRRENGLSANTPLPADIVTASGSGLDPDISVEAALLQVNRIVAARYTLGGTNAAITAEKVRQLIAQHTQGRDLGVLGEPRVNVLELNLALDAAFGAPVPGKRAALSCPCIIERMRAR
jgi:potassium-transporting ATPase KdpC subunit